MKLSLSIKVSIKDIYPKDKSIQYEKYICLFTLNNFKATLSLSNLKIKNFIKHKLESYNSDIIYNLHMFDSTKNSLIGIYQLIINFGKIKHLNINDTLTQEETAKLIIAPKTKRKIYDKITKMGNIYLILSTEIKIINKKLLSSKIKPNSNNIKKRVILENSEKISDFKTSPKTFKKKQIIRTMENNMDIVKKKYKNVIIGNNEISLIDGFRDENDTTFSLGNVLKKYKSLTKAKIKGQNNNILNDFYNNIYNINSNQDFNNSYTFIMSPKYSHTNINLNKDDNTNIKINNKNSIIHNKVPISNLMEQELETSLYKQKEDSFFGISNKKRDFKSTAINFNKTKIYNIKQNSFNNYNILITIKME